MCAFHVYNPNPSKKEKQTTATTQQQQKPQENTVLYRSKNIDTRF